MEYSLHTDNIVPFYLIEDRIKHNFTTIDQFIKDQRDNNSNTHLDINNLRTDSAQFKAQIDQKLAEVQTKIITDIGRELEGRIIVAINKNMASFTARMEEKQQQIADFSSGIQQKLDSAKKSILFEGSKQTQKTVKRELQKLQKQLQASLKQKQSPEITSPAQPTPSSREPQRTNFSHQIEAADHEAHFNEEWVLRIKELEEKIGRTEGLMVGYDKRFYDNMTSLKDSWKELGEEVLETKKKLGSRQDELRLQLVKVRGVKEFQGSPEDYEPTFKAKLMDKFTDMYQLLGQLVTRTDLESDLTRIKKICVRHDGQLNDVREQMAKNDDYFTFYANNSDQQDLSSKIKALQQELQQIHVSRGKKEETQARHQQLMQQGFLIMRQQVDSVNTRSQEAEAKVAGMRELLLKEMERVNALEEHNNFTPQKMAKIHNTLDHQYSSNQQELIEKKHSNHSQSQDFKKLKDQLSKVKDQLFVVNHQLAEVEKIKKLMSGLEGRVDKIKFQSQQAMLSRKPWVCLSCDKNEKEKHDQDKAKRDLSRRKGQQGKGLFSKDKSDKLIKPIPVGQDKFQVYQKYREKYLSQSVRLPDIYKEKIGDKEPPLG